MALPTENIVTEQGVLDFNAQQAQLDRDFQAEQARVAYERSAQEAEKQRAFEERLSSSAYSRAIADLRKNGVNPYVALSSLSPASTPSGATGSAYGVSGSSASSSLPSRAVQSAMVSSLGNLAAVLLRSSANSQDSTANALMKILPFLL